MEKTQDVLLSESSRCFTSATSWHYSPRRARPATGHPHQVRPAGDFTERFGNSDDLAADTIRTPPGYNANPPSGQPGYAPGCFLKGVTITADYEIQNNTGRPLGVMIGVGLTNSDDGGTYWIRQYGIPNLLPYPDVHSVTLPALPDHIANLNLGFTFTFMVRGMYGGWQPAGQQVLQPIRLHTVLGQPQTPMNPPWDPVLEIACKWMSRTSTVEAAQQKLTERMMGVKYDAANKPYIDDSYAVWRYDSTYVFYTEFTGPVGARTGEKYFLRRWLNETANGTQQKPGGCGDVSNLWVIMATAVGCARVHLLIGNPETLPDNFYPKPGYWSGRTSSGLRPTNPNVGFDYHQVGWSDVYDAAITFQGALQGNTYYIRWTDSNADGIIDDEEYLATAKLALGVVWDNYRTPGWLWRGDGPEPVQHDPPTLPIELVYTP